MHTFLEPWFPRHFLLPQPRPQHVSWARRAAATLGLAWLVIQGCYIPEKCQWENSLAEEHNLPPYPQRRMLFFPDGNKLRYTVRVLSNNGKFGEDLNNNAEALLGKMDQELLKQPFSAYVGCAASANAESNLRSPLQAESPRSANDQHVQVYQLQLFLFFESVDGGAQSSDGGVQSSDGGAP